MVLITIKFSPLYSLPLEPMTFWLIKQKLYLAGSTCNEPTRYKALKLLDLLCSEHSLNPLLLVEGSLSTWQISLNFSMENIYKLVCIFESSGKITYPSELVVPGKLWDFCPGHWCWLIGMTVRISNSSVWERIREARKRPTGYIILF